MTPYTRDDRLGKAGEPPVEPELGFEKVCRLVVTPDADGVVERAQVAAGAKRALAGAVEQDDLDAIVVLPAVERRVDRVDHAVCQRVQGLRPIECQVAERARLRNEDVGHRDASRRERAMMRRMISLVPSRI